MELTYKEIQELHKELWTWISKNPEHNFKGDWFRWKRNGGDIENCRINCFACDFMHKYFLCCAIKGCPIIWSPITSYKKAFCIPSIFSEYTDAGLKKEWKKAAILALKIANLPWREEKELL